MQNIFLQYDVARGRIPKIETIKKQIKMLKPYGLNGITLYLESVISGLNLPYAGCGETPITFDYLTELRDFCDSEKIQLMPIFQTIAHQGNLLARPDMLQYAEDVDSRHEFRIDDSTLTKMQMEDIAKVSPFFNSPYIHLGGDEAIRVGLGKSRELCQKLGFENAIANYYNRWNEFIISLGKKMVIYGDFLIHYPKLAQLLDSSIVICNWNYSTYEEVYELENHNFAMHSLITQNREHFISGNCMAEYILPQFKRLETNMDIWLNLAKETAPSTFIISDWGTKENYNPFVSTIIGAIYILKRLSGEKLSSLQLSRLVAKLFAGEENFILAESISRMINIAQNSEFFPKNLNYIGPIMGTLLFSDPDSPSVIRLTSHFDSEKTANLLKVARDIYASFNDSTNNEYIDELKALARRLLMLAIRTSLLLNYTWYFGAIWVKEEDTSLQKSLLQEFEAIAAEDKIWCSQNWDKNNLETCKKHCIEMLDQLILSTRKTFKCPNNVLLHYPPCDIELSVDKLNITNNIKN